MNYTIKLLTKKDLTIVSMVWTFAKPKGFTYKAGQYCEFSIPNFEPTKNDDGTRCLSLVSNPEEDNIVIASNIRDSAFKQHLKALEIGQEIKMSGPYGDFKLHQNTDIPTVMIAGGIGITAIYSLLKDVLRTDPNRNITLFHSVNTFDTMHFYDELENLNVKHKNFKFVPTITDMYRQAWKGEIGRIDLNLLNKYVPDLTKPNYYLCGSSSLVNGMHKLLTNNKVREDNIRSEEFPGY